MTRRATKYRRCKKCRELVRDPDHCKNCANINPLGFQKPNPGFGAKARLTLDIQEGNDE